MSEALPGSDDDNAARARMLGAVSAALLQLSIETETMGEKLCVDPDIVSKHLDRLQDIDRITQTLRELSGVIIAPSVADAIGNIGLGDLQRELADACAQ